MERRTGLLLIAIALGGYGVYRALYAIAMLPAPASLLLLLAFALEAVLAILAAVGVWRERDWAAAAVLRLGASIAADGADRGGARHPRLADRAADRDRRDRGRAPARRLAEAPPSGRVSIGASWARRAERGSLGALHLMLWMYRRLGRSLLFPGS